MAVVALPALTLLLADVWLAAKHIRHDRLLAAYECGYLDQPPCVADFDGDGRPTSIQVSCHTDAPAELPPVSVGHGREPARLNGFCQDNTFRTHLAVRGEAGAARLLIYDGSRRPVRAVYAWGGEKLSEVAAAGIDEEILSAMAARDDTGDFHRWVIYRMLAWPMRIVYVPSIIFVVLLYRGHRRAARKLP
jgi:hypothetical protein